MLFCLTIAVCSAQAQTTQQEEPVFEVCEVMPQFPGGLNEMMNYLSTNIRYPKEAQKEKIEGRSVVQFVVETDGSLSSFSVMKSSHPLLDAEALRVIKSMPKWTPGTQGGKFVRVQFALPVSFRLN